RSGDGRGPDAPHKLGCNRIEGVMTAQEQTRIAAPSFRRTVPVALLAVVLLSSLGGGPGNLSGGPAVALAVTPLSDPASATPLGDIVTFFGRGYGHGVGMSQYGARGRALGGEDSATILAHYYQGTTLVAIDPATRIRVLVLSRWSATD